MGRARRRCCGDLARTSPALPSHSPATSIRPQVHCVVLVAAAAVVMLPFALLAPRPIQWTPTFVAALAWLVVALSIVAIALLAVLVRRGAATKVASLFYLVPPCTALMAYVAFGERLLLSELGRAGLINDPGPVERDGLDGPNLQAWPQAGQRTSRSRAAAGDGAGSAGRRSAFMHRGPVRRRGPRRQDAAGRPHRCASGGWRPSAGGR